MSEPVEKADGDESTGRREMRQRASRERRRGGVQLDQLPFAAITRRHF